MVLVKGWGNLVILVKIRQFCNYYRRWGIIVILMKGWGDLVIVVKSRGNLVISMQIGVWL